MNEAFKSAGLDYPYTPTAMFATACAGSDGPFKLVGGTPQAGDVLLFTGHMGLWDPEGCTVLGTNSECKRLQGKAPLLSSRSTGNRGPDFGVPAWWGAYRIYRWVGSGMPTVGVAGLRKDQFIEAKGEISPAKVAHWRYAKECASIGSGLATGSRLKVVETSTLPGAMWVCAEISGSSPSRTLKIAGDEFAMNFRVSR